MPQPYGKPPPNPVYPDGAAPPYEPGSTPYPENPSAPPYSASPSTAYPVKPGTVN